MFWFRSGIKRPAPIAARHIVASEDPKKFGELDLVLSAMIDL
jgi:hypothetical protein